MELDPNAIHIDMNDEISKIVVKSVPGDLDALVGEDYVTKQKFQCSVQSIKGDSGVTNPMTEDFSMGSHRIRAMAGGILGNDAVILEQIVHLPKQSQDWHIGDSGTQYKVGWLAPATHPHEAVNKEQLDAALRALPTQTLDVSMGNNRLVDMADGVDLHDAVNKGQIGSLPVQTVDWNIGSDPGNHRRIGWLAAATEEHQAVNKGQLDASLASLPAQTDHFDMGDNNIHNLGTALDPNDAVNKDQFDTALAAVLTNPMTEDLDMGSHSLINLGGTEPNDRSVNLHQLYNLPDQEVDWGVGCSDEQKKILYLAPGSQPHDAVNKQQLDAAVLNMATNPMGADLDMNYNKLTHVTAGTSTYDAVNYGQITNLPAQTDNLSMGNNNLSDLADGDDGLDACNMSQIWNLPTQTGALNMGINQINNMAVGVLPGDAATVGQLTLLEERIAILEAA